MKNAISPDELAGLLADAPAGLRMLSLDCFDTLIWRCVHAPREVFADLGPDAPTRQQRIWAERHARNRALLRTGRSEVRIEDIYAQLLPNADASFHAMRAAREWKAEARHCFAFRPTVELIRSAKALGLEVAIVSDTYLSRDQLAALIGSAGGEELLRAIDHIFCSSEHGRSKCEGLFARVLRATGRRPGEVLHVGDNRAADFEAARAAGLHACHLVQFAPSAEQRLRLEAAADAMIAASGGGERPALQPHRAASALLPHGAGAAAELGHSVLGPVFHGFAGWVARQAAALARPGSRAHLLFLMRDGHLPKRVHDALGLAPQAPAHAVEISRFTAIAASFRTEEEVMRFLEAEAEGGDWDGIARQLLLAPGEAASLIRKLPRKGAARAFVDAVRGRETMRRILARSRDFAGRLADYVRAEVAPAPGDTLVLVDLGYNGTVQDCVEPVLREALGVSVAGRYLLLREQKMSGFDKKGFIDARRYDPGVLDSLCGNVAVVEQLCTAAQGSVVDYEDGRPVRTAIGIKARQSETREAVQEACVRFVLARDAAFLHPPASDDGEARRQAAAAALARLMFLPLPAELDVLRAFEHDVNLGGEDIVRLFDPEVADEGLKRRGLFYLKGAERMYLPAELRGHGLPLSLALLTQRRFALDLRFADFCDAAIELPVIVAEGQDVSVATVSATPSHGGWFVAAIPIGDCRFAIGLQFGRICEWVQVDSAEFVPVADYPAGSPGARAASVEALPSLEGMDQVAPHLLHCRDEAAFMMVPPPLRRDGAPMMLCVAFRPIAARVPAQPETPVTAAIAEGAAG
jgi:FMN phosphatase YigB (HAD superfamily)